MPLNTKTFVTTAKGDLVFAKNFLHSFGMRRPLTLAIIALIVGNGLGVVTHL